MEENKSMCSFVRYESSVEGGMISLSEMRAFLNHPYHVEKDSAMLELVDSIQTEGVLVPLLIRPIEDEQYGFEIISGHRRKMDAEMAGLSEVPAIIRDMDDDQAVIAMTDSNLHREYIRPSEKAYAYKMRLEAMKHQGKKTMMTSAQVEPKCEEPQGVKKLTPNTKLEEMVDMSSITAVEIAEKERDAALGKLKAEKRRIEAAGKLHKEEVIKINIKYRNQIKKLKKELDFLRIASGVLLIVSITLVYQLISTFI